MNRSAVKSGIYAAVAAGGGLLFGSAACFAVASFFVVLGCPEARQVCQEAVDLAGSITKVWYLFAVPVGTAAGIVIYHVARSGSLPLKKKIAENSLARIVIYAIGAVVSLMSLLIAAIVGFITSSRANTKCPVESAYKCSEASAGEIVAGFLFVCIALTVAIATVVAVYRFTRSTVAS